MFAQKAQLLVLEWTSWQLSPYTFVNTMVIMFLFSNKGIFSINMEKLYYEENIILKKIS